MTPGTKRGLFWLALLLAVFGLGQCEARRDAADAERAAASAATQATVDSLRAEAARLTAQPPDTVIVRRVVRAAAQVDTATAATDAAIVSIPDTLLRQVVDSAVRTERAAWAERLAARRAFYEALLAVRDSALAHLDSAIVLLTNDRDRWKSVNKQRRFACVAGGGATLALTGAGAVGPSVTCGVRVF